MKYQRPAANEWVSPTPKGYKMACCDCGLVHDMDFAIIKYGNWRKVVFRVRRNNRATAALRRAKKKELSATNQTKGV